MKSKICHTSKGEFQFQIYETYQRQPILTYKKPEIHLFSFKLLYIHSINWNILSINITQQQLVHKTYTHEHYIYA